MDKIIATDIKELLEMYDIPEEAAENVKESIWIGEKYIYDLTFELF